MKARGCLLVLVCTLAALSAAPGLTNSAAAKSREIALSSFKVEASNGYEVEVGAVRFGKVKSFAEVKVESGSLDTTYEVQADSAAGIHATFDTLGAVGASFRRHSRKVLKPARGCRWIIETGTFRGSFHFTGEDGYVSVEATDPEGEAFRLPNGFCGLGGDRPAFPDLGLDQDILLAKGQAAHGPVLFEASRFSKEKSASFNASLKERIGAMKVVRSAQARGGKESFTSSGASQATVAPPPPFVGTAQLHDPADGPATWTGTLSVPFLGAPDTPLAGEGFDARLCPRQPILKPCRL